MLQRAATSIAKAAGWTVPAPDTEGTVTFRLADGLRLELFSPDGHTVILCGPVCLLPRQSASEAEAMVEKALRLAAAAGRRRSILSLTPPEIDVDGVFRKRRLILHRIPRPADYPDLSVEEIFTHEARGLLNDLVWWRKQLCDIPTVRMPPGDFPFSFMAGI